MAESEESKNDICIGDLIASLPKKKRELLLLKYYEKLSYQEISKRTNSIEASIRKTIERTLSILQRKFKKKDVIITALLAQWFIQIKFHLP